MLRSITRLTAKAKTTPRFKPSFPSTLVGEPSLLAGYVCTPLVKIPVGKFDNQSTVKGTTVAELGNRNRPLDMIVYEQNGKNFLLMANSDRGVMKISTENLDENTGLDRTGPRWWRRWPTVRNDRVAARRGATRQAGRQHALVVIQQENAPMSLRAVELP